MASCNPFSKLLRVGDRLATGLHMIKPLWLLAVVLAAPLSATAQVSSVVGTWVLAGAEKLLPDGTHVSDYGPNPHGLVIFTTDGYYSVQIYRAERQPFSSGDKLKGTPEAYIPQHERPLRPLQRRFSQAHHHLSH